MSGASDAVAWDELRPVLDAAMHELGERDREVILLRFFERRSLAEVGAATGLAENSARMRVERALEKLRSRLARRGITSTAAALGVALVGQPTVAAPAGLVASVVGTAMAGAAAAGGGGAVALAVLHSMNTTKLAVGAACAVVAAGVGAFLGIQYQTRASQAAVPMVARADGAEAALGALREENRRLKEELSQRRGEPAAQPGERGAGAAAASGAAATGRSAQWRILADLQVRNLATPQISFVNAAGKLEDAFVSLFELTTGECESLQQAVTKASEQLAVLERENATVSRDGKGGVVIAIKPFAEAGGVVYDEVMKAFAQTLGTERNAAFLTLGAEKVEKTLGRFGAEQRTVTITRVAESASGADGHTNAVLVSDVRRTLNGTNSNSSDHKSFAEAAARLGTLVKLVPPDF